MQAYTLGTVLGEGTFGTVREAAHRSTGEKVAIKRMKSDTRDGIPCTTLREVALLSRLKHPNVLGAKEVFAFENSIYLVLELCPCDLHVRIRATPSLSSHLRRSFAEQLLTGVEYLHSNGVVHRDLKPKNVLVTSQDVLKIGDFGLGRQMSQMPRDYTPTICTIWYRPPEVMLGLTRYGGNVDVWACGCILSEMVTRKPLFAKDSNADMLAFIFKTLGLPPPTSPCRLLPEWNSAFESNEGVRSLQFDIAHTACEPECTDLILRMLECDFERRITAREARSHDYFSARDSSRPCLKRSRSLP